MLLENDVQSMSSSRIHWAAQALHQVGGLRSDYSGSAEALVMSTACLAALRLDELRPDLAQGRYRPSSPLWSDLA